MQLKADTSITAPSPDDVALVIVTYYPDDEFNERAKALADRFTTVVIVDNSGPEASQIAQLRHENITTVSNPENLGLGCALNTGCERAQRLGYSWAATLDQDTVLAADYLPSMLSAWKTSKSSLPVLGCNYFNVSRSTYKFTPSKTPLARETVTAITSGCLTHLPTWSSLGKFREDYFIDSIDHEFCLRARKAGYRVAVNLQPLMTHTIGEDSKYLRLFKSLTPYTHSFWRTYTTTRNTVRTMLEYATSEPTWCARKAAGLALDIVVIMALEREKIVRLRAFYCGLLHGFQNKMGAPEPHIMNLKKPGH